MSSSTATSRSSKTPSILALNRFFKPSAFNTGPPIPSILPLSLTPSTTPSDTSSHPRAGTPELTSSPASSVSSLPSTSGSSLDLSIPSSSYARMGAVPLTLESERVRQIFDQPLLVDLLAGKKDSDQDDDQELADKMNLHLNLLQSGGAPETDHSTRIDAYEVEGGYTHPEGYYQDEFGNIYVYAPEGVNYDPYNPAYAHLIFNQPSGQGFPHDHGLYAVPEAEFDVPQTARPEDYFAYQGNATFPAAPPPSAAFALPTEFGVQNPNLNPHALPFVPSSSSGTLPTSDAFAPTSEQDDKVHSAPVPKKEVPLYPPGLPIPQGSRKNGLNMLVERANARLGQAGEQ